MQVCRLTADDEVFRAFRDSYEHNNAGYRLARIVDASAYLAGDLAVVVFVQSFATEAHARVESGGDSSTPQSSLLAVGDVVLLRAGDRLTTSAPLDALVFEIPADLAALPTFIRPDFDPRITDTLGGCATQGAAYRRILLTWLGDNGPYVLHALNAHRVRMTDSFTHYHPIENGFDEFYLVQDVEPGARVWFSLETDRLTQPDALERDDVGTLLEYYEPAIGDMVYLPRGTTHRAVGGVLAQVITTPGFIPGVEIGVDHHLKAINERFGIEGAEALPYHAPAADAPLVR